MTPFEIVNEDGTSMDDFPKNPLAEKWKRYSQVCDGYSCAFCGRCPRGDYWKIPEEDKEIWAGYQKQLKEYNRIHNPSMYKFEENNYYKED